MKLKMVNEFACEPRLLWEIFDDPEFERRLEEETGVRREGLEVREEGGISIKRLRCISLKEMPAMMKKALGVEQFEFEQENRFDAAAGLLTWTITTPFLTDRVEAGGTTRVKETAGGCLRTIEGKIEIRLPIVGKQMEKRLAQNVEESYQKAAEIAATMIEGPKI